jgi:AcrR family transcriptional regulator
MDRRPQADPAAPAREPPTRGRNARQEDQRRQTRQTLLAAACEVFAERGYLETSVEHVLTRAGVSRAAFYAHFDSKLALVCEIAAEFVPQWRPTFDALAGLPGPSIEALEAWAGRHMEFHRTHWAVCGLLTQVAGLEERLYAVLAAQRDALIDDLGERLAAFRRARVDPAARLRARLLLSQMDETCFLLVRGRIPDPEGHGARVIAEQLQAFLLTAEQPSS